MPIKLQCPECKTVSAAPDGQAGRFVRCKRCNTKFSIPQGAPTLPVGPSAVGRVPVPPGSPAVIDRYEVRELLGAGAFGSVYRAFDPKLGREVALKVLGREMTSSPQAIERFLREAKAAAKLNHPHIVAVFDADRAGDVYFIASAFIKGGTLASSLPETGMEPRRAAELAAQLASALGYAHRQGVVHRDVKPANILLDEQGSLQLMDFGLAGYTQDECTRLTREGAVMGTPAYMAPEQASGDTKQIGPAADLYSAGVVLYELLTARRPFDGVHPTALMYLIVHSDPQRPSELRPDLDAGLEAICLKAMAKKPADRFADGEAMAAALRAWAPTAIRLAEPIATKTTTRLPNPVFEWDRQTVNFGSSALKNARPTLATRLGGAFQQIVIIANRLSLKKKIWGGAFLVVLSATAMAAVTIFLFPRWTPPGQMGGAGLAVPSSNGPISEKRPKSEPVLTQGLPGSRLTPIQPRSNPAPAEVLSGLSPKSAQLQLDGGTELPEEIVNFFDVRMKLIKPGTFLMGSPKEEARANQDEHPQHLVEITRPFYLGVYPVTQAEYVQVTGFENPSWFAKGAGGKSSVLGLDTSIFPGEYVNWKEAVSFCEALNRLDGKKPKGWKYALPTEAEWEYACRAGSTTVYSFGDDAQQLGDHAWYASDSEMRTHAVGTRLANSWGLRDMTGNVYQWCADWYDSDYYTNKSNKDPQCVVPGQVRVLRGGCWSREAEGCRASSRYWEVPSLRLNYVGMRISLRPD